MSTFKQFLQQSNLTEAKNDSIARKLHKILTLTKGQPQEMKKRVAEMSDKELRILQGDTSDRAGDGSARKLQIDLIAREMKKRGIKS